MDVQPIRTEAEYDLALAEIAKHFDRAPNPGSAEGDHFDALAAALLAYEEEHWSISPRIEE